MKRRLQLAIFFIAAFFVLWQPNAHALSNTPIHWGKGGMRSDLNPWEAKNSLSHA